MTAGHVFFFQPFWPTGSGCARGFLGCFDAAWTMRGWGLGREPLDLLAERDSIFRLLAQTTPENISKNFDEYSINPLTRYPNLNKSSVTSNRIKHLYDNHHGPIDQKDGSEPMDTSKDLSTIEGGGKRGKWACLTLIQMNLLGRGGQVPLNKCIVWQGDISKRLMD